MDFSDNSTGYTIGAFGTILKTMNGGDNRNQLNSGSNVRLLSVDFINSESGYIGGQAQWRWDFVAASHGGSFHAPL